ncbi:APC family permease [Leptolyngbya sp. 15MV]|nr:APC family permease [Leptolyngbya sp. 15MV]
MPQAPAKGPGRKLGLFAAIALVMGNMIGSGVFLLPASLAPFGWNGVFGWIVTIAGALVLAYLLARLTKAHPAAGGPAGFVEAAFGETPAFLIGWIYLVSIWTAVVTIAVAAVSYLSSMVPALSAQPARPVLAAMALLGAMTVLNLRGVRAAGNFQVATLLLKLVPLIVVIVLAAGVLAGGEAELAPFEPAAIGLGAINGAAALTLWALLGFECASVQSIGQSLELLLGGEAGEVLDGQPEHRERLLCGRRALGRVHERPLHELQAVLQRLQVRPRLLGGEAQLAQGLGANAGAQAHLVKGVAHAGEDLHAAQQRRDRRRADPRQARAGAAQPLAEGLQALLGAAEPGAELVAHAEFHERPSGPDAPCFRPRSASLADGVPPQERQIRPLLFQRRGHERPRGDLDLPRHQPPAAALMDNRLTAMLQRPRRGALGEPHRPDDDRVAGAVVPEEDQLPQAPLVRVRRLARRGGPLPLADAGAGRRADERAGLAQHLPLGRVHRPHDDVAVEEHVLDPHGDHADPHESPPSSRWIRASSVCRFAGGMSSRFFCARCAARRSSVGVKSRSSSARRPPQTTSPRVAK